MQIQNILSDALLKSLEFGGVMDDIGESSRADVKLRVANATATVYFDRTDDARSFIKTAGEGVECTLHLITPNKDHRTIHVMEKPILRKRKAAIFQLLKDGMTVFEFIQVVKRLGGDATDLGYFLVRGIIRLDS